MQIRRPGEPVPWEILTKARAISWRGENSAEIRVHESLRVLHRRRKTESGNRVGYETRHFGSDAEQKRVSSPGQCRKSSAAEFITSTVRVSPA